MIGGATSVCVKTVSLRRDADAAAGGVKFFRELALAHELSEANKVRVGLRGVGYSTRDRA